MSFQEQGSASQITQFPLQIEITFYSKPQHEQKCIFKILSLIITLNQILFCFRLCPLDLILLSSFYLVSLVVIPVRLYKIQLNCLNISLPSLLERFCPLWENRSVFEISTHIYSSTFSFTYLCRSWWKMQRDSNFLTFQQECAGVLCVVHMFQTLKKITLKNSI